MNKYKIEIYATYNVWVWGDDEEEAKEKAQMKVFEEKINHKNGDLIIGYKITPLKVVFLMPQHAI